MFEGIQLRQYQIRRLVGHGGVGDVYLADDQKLLRQVALKIVQSENPTNEIAKEATRLFQREAQMIANLNHPNILPLFDFGEAVVNDVNFSYLVMPFCPEGSLRAWLRQHMGSLIVTPHDVSHMVRQAADALEYAHDSQIIHRDVKPSNFLVRSRKDTPSRPDLLLADFGIARLAHDTVNTSTSVRGTPTYMAPEQWRAHPVPATDQYALAIMTYGLLTGRPPFQGTQEQVMYQHIMNQPQRPSTFNARIPSRVDTVVLRALAKQPADRYPSISAFADAFQQAVMELPLSFPPVRSTEGPPSLPPSFPSVSDVPNISGLHMSPPNILEPKVTMPAIPTPADMERKPPSTAEPIATDLSCSPISLPSGPSISKPGANQSIPGLAPSRITWKTLSFTGLALLLLVVSVVLISPLGKTLSPVNASNATATANASNATIQAVQSTVSATVSIKNAEASATAQVQATTAVNENLNDPTMKKLKLHELLTGNSTSGWDENSACTFATDGYHVISSVQVAHKCIAHNFDNLGDFTFQIQMSILNGTGGGLLFRVTSSTAYYFRISNDGHYALLVCLGTDCSRILVSSFSSFYDSQRQPNVLGVVVKGMHIQLYVNGVPINSADDNGPLYGQIGLATEGGSEVVFSDAKIWTA